MKAFGSRLLRTAILLGSFVASAATAADYSGTWVRDTAKSTPAPYPNYWMTRVAPQAGFNNNAYIMQVRQTAASVDVTDPVHPQRTYLLDGRSHTVPTDTLRQAAVVSAAMLGGSLSVTTTQPYGGMPGNVTLVARESWSLSPDGRVLTITTVRDLPAQHQTFREVYNRQ